MVGQGPRQTCCGSGQRLCRLGCAGQPDWALLPLQGLDTVLCRQGSVESAAGHTAGQPDGAVLLLCHCSLGLMM